MTNNDAKILVVEDSEIAMLSIVHCLNSKACGNISPCVNGHDAVDTFKKDPAGYAIILLDMELPDINGLEVAKQIRGVETQSRIEQMLTPIVVTSSYVDQEQKREFVNLGITHFFKKPLSENCKKAILQIMGVKNLVEGTEPLNNDIALYAVQEYKDGSK